MHFHSQKGMKIKDRLGLTLAGNARPRCIQLFVSLPLCKTKQLTPHGVSCFVAIADKIDAVDFGIKIRKLEKMLCCNNFSHFDAWIFLIFIIGQNRCIHLNFCSGNELEDFKKDFDPSNIGILQYTPLAHAHKTIHRSQKC